MEDDQDFILEIGTLLEKRAEVIEQTILSRLHENFSIYNKSVQTIFNVLVRKSLLQEDPYKYEQKISELSIPSQAPIAESDKSMQMSIRLSNFDSQLEYLNHYYQFSLDFLTMKRIKTLASLTTYIKWERSNASADSNTGILIDIMNKIQYENDSVSHGILNSAKQDLVKLTKLILRDLKDITSYHREAYKQDIRQNIIPSLGIDEKQYVLKPDAIPRQIRQKFTKERAGTPFYNDLVLEVIEELYSENKGALQETLLSKYRTKEVKKVEKKTQTHKKLLLEALKALSNGGTYLEQALSKLRGNVAILETKKESLGEKFRKWLQNIVSKDTKKIIMELEIFEEETSISKTIRIDFNVFNEKAVKQARVLQALGTEMNQTFQRIAEAPEDKIFQYLTEKIAELQKTCTYLGPAETFLKTEAPREQRGKLSSVDKDILNIKNCIQSTNKKRFDYAARTEEQEQLRKLGIE